MVMWIDSKYVKMLASKLRNFRQKNDSTWNASCPFCGDSKKNPHKARLWVYPHKSKNVLLVKCHNCGISTNLYNLIKYVDPNLAHEYTLEQYKEGVLKSDSSSKSSDEPSSVATLFRPELSDATLDSLKRLDLLSPEHPAVKYCLDRKINRHQLQLLYFAPRFKHYVNSVIPGKFEKIEKDHPRLIIPYLNKHGKCFAFQGRAFGKEEPKYITIKIDEDAERIFGLDRVDYGKKVYIVEGPIDSLFIPNCLAVSGSSFNSPSIKALRSHCTVVYDNEPRSKELTSLIDKTIKQGYNICLWPETIKEKDINEMILAGRTSKEIVEIINDNTYRGATAKLRFATWKKC